MHLRWNDGTEMDGNVVSLTAPKSAWLARHFRARVSLTRAATEINAYIAIRLHLDTSPSNGCKAQYNPRPLMRPSAGASFRGEGGGSTLGRGSCGSADADRVAVFRRLGEAVSAGMG